MVKAPKALVVASGLPGMAAAGGMWAGGLISAVAPACWLNPRPCRRIVPLTSPVPAGALVMVIAPSTFRSGPIG